MTDATTHGAVDMGSFFYDGEEWYTKDYADEVIAGLQSRLTDWQASQGYRYIGKDGKSVLARDLEDERDALRLEVTRLKMQAAVMDAWLAGEPSEPPRTGRAKSPVQAHGEPDAAEGE